MELSGKKWDRLSKKYVRVVHFFPDRPSSVENSN
jgi:hypothetical protein